MTSRTIATCVNRRRLALMAGAACLFAVPTHAQERVWTGGGDGTNWSDGDNWQGGSTPAPGEDAVLTNGSAPPARIESVPITIASLTVGRNGAAGSLVINTGLDDGSLLTSGRVTGIAGLGNGPMDLIGAGADGTVVLSGANSRWTSDADYIVVGAGDTGSGFLQLRSSTYLIAGGLAVGVDEGVGAIGFNNAYVSTGLNSGTAIGYGGVSTENSVTDTTWSMYGALDIGVYDGQARAGTGALQVTGSSIGNGDVSNPVTITLGRGAGSSGSMNLSDSTALFAGSFVQIGMEGGDGLLFLSNGSEFRASEIVVGWTPGSTGRVEALGSLVSANTITAGLDGGAGELIAEQDGRIVTAGTLYLGDGAGSTGRLIVSQGSVSVGSELIFGIRGGGGSGTMVGGGEISVGGNFRLGGGTSGDPRNPQVTYATGSAAFDLRAGTLRTSINEDSWAQIGLGEGSEGRLNIFEGAQWIDSVLIAIGGGGGLGEVAARGGTIEADSIIIGAGPDGLAGLPSGTGRGTLSVLSGGRLTADTLIAGLGDATLNLSGAGSVAELDLLGLYGSLDGSTRTEVTVEDSGTLRAEDVQMLGGNITLNVTTRGLLQANEIRALVDADSYAAELNINVLNGTLLLGGVGDPTHAGSMMIQGGTTNISVAGDTGYLSGGADSGIALFSAGTLHITDGGQLRIGALLVLDETSTSRVTVDGGATVTIGAPGEDANSVVLIGTDATISGATTSWDSGALTLGDGQFVLSGGARMRTRAEPSINFGGRPNDGVTRIGGYGTAGMAVLDEGTVWAAEGDVAVGATVDWLQSSGVGSLTIDDGGRADIAGSLIAGDGADAEGSIDLNQGTLAVGGDLILGRGGVGSIFVNDQVDVGGAVYLGTEGGRGSLDVYSGGALNALRLFVGGSDAGWGGVDTTGTGAVNITSGGMVDVQSYLVLGSGAGSLGRVNVSFGGRLDVGDLAVVGDTGGEGYLSASRGGLVLLDGNLEVGRGYGEASVTGQGSVLGTFGSILVNNGILSITDHALAGSETGGATITGNGTLELGSTAAFNLREALELQDGAAVRYVIEAPGAAAGNDVATVLASGGIAIGDGVTLDVAFTQLPQLGDSYVIAQATNGSALTGRFDYTPSLLTAFAGFDVRYDARSATLDFTQIRPLADAALTPNQRAAAGGADALALNAPLKAAIVMLPDDAAARDAFDQISGEIHASALTALSEDLRVPRNAVLDRLAGEPGTGALWGRAFLTDAMSDGDRNAADLERNARGVVIGADLPVGGATLGIAGSYSTGDIAVTDRASRGDREIYQLMAYTGVNLGGVALRAGGGWAHGKLDVTRSVAFAGFSDSLAADRSGDAVFGFAELGYRVQLGGGWIEPIAAASAERWSLDGTTERGGDAALTVSKTSFDTVRSTLGARFATPSTGPLTIRGRVAWEHGFGTLAPMVETRLPDGAPAAIAGTPLSRDAGTASIETSWRITPSLSLDLGYDGYLGTGGAQHAGRAGVTLRF